MTVCFACREACFAGMSEDLMRAIRQSWAEKGRKDLPA